MSCRRTRSVRIVATTCPRIYSGKGIIMSTEPTTKAVSPTTGGELGKIRSFLLDHERLLIVIIAAIFLWWGYGKYAQIRLDHDNAVLAQQKLITDAQVKANQQMAQQVAEDKAQYQALSDKVTAQNQQLVAANTALATAL